MSGLKIDEATAKRMGYEGILAAETLPSDGRTVEICLLSHDSLPGGQYHVAVHVDCDPDEPHRGTSSMEPCGTSIEEAGAYYKARLSELSRAQEPPAPGKR
jgi:hypothetical protein